MPPTQRIPFSLVLVLAFAFAFALGPRLPGEIGTGEPSAGNLVLQPGVHPIGITRFPALRGDVSDRISISQLFGRENEAGILEGNAETADLLWIFDGRGFQRLYYAAAARGTIPGWRNVLTGQEDQAAYTWPITQGLFFERRGEKPLTVTLNGFIKTSPVPIVIQPGVNYFNQVFDGEVTLADLRLEDVLQRGNPREMKEVDTYRNPETGQAFFLDERGAWHEVETFDEIDPLTSVVPGTFGIERNGDRIPHLLEMPSPRIRLRHFQGFEEDAIRSIDGSNLRLPDCLCAFLRHEDRAVTLHVLESTANRLVVRVGKHPPGVRTESVTVLRGEGLVGPIDFLNRAVRIDQSVRTFFSDRTSGDTARYEVDLEDPRRRSGERRFFSEFLDERALAILFEQPAWPAGTAMEIDLLLGFAEKKLALHVPRVTLLEECSGVECAQLVAQLVETALRQRELIIDDEIRFSVAPVGNRFGLLRLDFRNALEMGKLDVCALPPPAAPQISRATGVVAPGALIRIEGGDFGNRLEDLCLVLAPPAENQSLPTIPLRPVGLTPDGNELFARVVGIVSDGQPRRLMIAKGEGYQRHLEMPFPDVWQQETVWAWRGLGVPAAVSPEPLPVTLGSEHEQRFAGAVTPAGTLEVTLTGDWPEEAHVRVAFTANTETVQLDSYAPTLCFSAGGTLLDCAARIKSAIERAFIQGGLADGNQVQIQINVTGENEVTLTASIFTAAGAEDPILSGHLEVSVSEEEEPCLPGESEDSDGDYIDDGWEVAQFGALPPLVIAGDDEDADGLSNAFEFAFGTEPKFKDVPKLNVIIDDDHGLITYARHETAVLYYHFGIETSMDEGLSWTRLNNLDVIEINPVESETVTILSRVFLSVEELNRSLFRLKVTPR